MIVENEISEKYRKYLISFKILDTEYFSIWGTDIENGEIDKLVLNSEGDPMLSTDINGLRNFLLDNEQLLFDKKNFIFWLSESKEAEPYTSYNLSLVKELIDLDQPFLNGDHKEMLIEVFNFLNLFSDLAYQKKDSEFISIYENKNNQMFIDYVYTIFFWTSSDEKILEIESVVRQEFNEELFRKHLKELYDYFLSIVK